MLNADFLQTVTIDGVEINVSDMSIRESLSEPVPQIDFRVIASANTQQQIDKIAPDEVIRVEQQSQGRSRVWNAVISELSMDRQNHDDVYVLQCDGESEILARRRFTYLFENTTASAVIKEALDQFGGYAGLSQAGIEQNETDVGIIVAREDTIFDIIEKMAKRTGWSWRVEDSVLYFFDPENNPAPFSLETEKNIASGSMSIKEDVKQVRNVIKAEAYEYKTQTVTKTVSGCTQAIYGPRFDSNLFEYVGDAQITSPSELSDRNIDIDLFSGRISFQQPLILEDELGEDDDPNEQEFDVTVVYTVRRKLIAEARDEGSIGIYGERHGVFNPGNGGDDLDTVFTKIKSELSRKAFALSTASCESTEFGLTVGEFVTVVPGGAFQPISMRVDSVRHTTSGAEMQIDIELSSRAFVGVDAVPELAQRVENLEKVDINPRSISGRIVREVGNVVEVDPFQSFANITSEVNSTAIVDKVNNNGGGQLQFTPSFVFNMQNNGGGQLQFKQSSAFNMQNNGGGQVLFGQSSVLSVENNGGGSTEFFINAITTEEGVTRESEDGIIRSFE